MAAVIFLKIDSSRLNAALKISGEFSRRTPAELANTAGFFAMRDAVRKAPKVPVSRIDKELAVEVQAVIGRRGKPLSTKYARNQVLVGRAGTARPPLAHVPIAAIIMSARANPRSNYNRSTNNRYAISHSPWKGVDRKTGAALMKAAISRMIKARHSAVAFLASSLIPVIRGLEAHVDRRYRRGVPAMDSEASRSYKRSRVDKGHVAPAFPGEISANCTIEIVIGMVGVNFASHNEAMHRYLAPVIQAALDTEALKQLTYAGEKAGGQLRSELRAMGAAA